MKTNKSRRGRARAAKQTMLRAANWLMGKTPVAELMKPKRRVEEIKIGTRHRKELGDVRALALDINERGLLHPVVIDRNNELIAGERRLKAWQHPDCIFRNEPIPVHVVPLSDIVAGEWAENDPALRKDFTPSESVAIKKAIESKLRPIAAARQAKAGGRGKHAAEGERVHSGDRAAAFTGKSRRTIEKAEAIVEAAEAEPAKYGKLKKDMDKSGRVDGPFKRLQVMKASEAIRKEPPPLPGNGPYRAGVIDFPWAAEPENDDPDRLARGYYPYPTMSLAQMVEYAREKIKPILHEDFLGALWITNYHLALGHQVPIIEALGATPVTIRTWRKDQMGRGQVLRGQTEHAVFFRIGKPALVVDNLTTEFHAATDKKAHSRKPQKFYSDFERLVAAPRYFTLFETVDRGAKWDAHGDKIEAAKQKEAAAVLAEKDRPDGAGADALAAAEYELLQAVAAGMLAIDGGARLDALFARKLIANRKKPRLTKAGEKRLAELKDAAVLAELLAKLPSDVDALIDCYRVALELRHAAVLAKDMVRLAIGKRDAEVAEIKANGGTSFGVAADDSPAEQLRKHTAAEIGVVPLWGQRGLFSLDVDGVPYIVGHDENLSIDVYAADPDKPFCSETGFQCLACYPEFDLSGTGDVEREIRLGETVDAAALRLIREAIAAENDSSGKRRPRTTPLPLPASWHRLPASWAEAERVAPIEAGLRPQADDLKCRVFGAGSRVGPKALAAMARKIAECAPFRVTGETLHWRTDGTFDFAKSNADQHGAIFFVARKGAFEVSRYIDGDGVTFVRAAMPYRAVEQLLLAWGKTGAPRRAGLRAPLHAEAAE